MCGDLANESSNGKTASQSVSSVSRLIDKVVKVAYDVQHDSCYASNVILTRLVIPCHETSQARHQELLS